MTFWWNNLGSGPQASNDNDFDTPSASNLVGLWDFNSGAETNDTGLADGVAQNGHFEGNAYALGGALILDGNHDYFDVNGDTDGGDDSQFDLASGTIELEFNQSSHVGSSPDTLVNRGEYCDDDTEGWFAIQVTDDGRVTVDHVADHAYISLQTGSHFFSPGDDVRVAYQWDDTGTGTFVVKNVTTGESYFEEFDSTGLNMNLGDDDDESFTFGAREYDDGDYDQFFAGEINYVAIYDTDVISPPDGIVEGTAGNDDIKIGYTGDPNGDVIDGGDALLPGEVGDDDIVLAGSGDDKVDAGAGNDEVYGESGKDELKGGAGDDLLVGGTQDDKLFGGTGNDTLDGGDGNEGYLRGEEGDDLILGGAGFDNAEGGIGNDTIDGGTEDDTISGGDGNDVLLGGDGIDRIDGGNDNDYIDGGSGSDYALKGNYGDDTIIGGDGDDKIEGGKNNDLLSGGAGADTIRGDYDRDTITDVTANDYIDGGSGGDDYDTLDLSGAGQVSIEYTSADNEDGIISFLDSNGNVTGTAEFKEIENIINAQQKDGYVEGTNSADLIDAAYTGDPDGDMIDAGDAILPGEGPDDDIVLAGDGNDTVLAGAGNDDVYAGGGDDSVEGGAGDDLILGDSDLAGVGGGGGETVRESFEWDLAPDPNGGDPIDNGDDLTAGFTQNTGNVDVTFSVLDASANVTQDFADNKQNVKYIDDGSETVDEFSSLSSTANGAGQSATYELDFSKQVEAVSFRVNDIDGDGIVSIYAYDAAGNQVVVNLDGGSRLTLLDNDSVPGAETADSQGDYKDDDTDYYSILVDIPGPVARIEIVHSQDGGNNSGINVTDVFFDVETGPVLGGGDPGNDTLSGGEGNDTILGEEGNDLITGGVGADDLQGGDDRDTFIGGDAGDAVDGGAGGDDYDTLDLSGEGPLRIVGETVDPDGNSTSGTVEFLDGSGNVTGSMTFTEIENLILPENLGPDAVDDAATTDEDIPVTINVLANDTDPETDPLTIFGTPTADNGTVVVNPDGTLTYTPDTDFNGTDTITYTIDDGNGGQDTAFVTVTVNSVNDDPVAVDDSATTDEDTPVTVNVLGNDTDVDGDTLEVLGTPTADHGTVVVNPDGTITYTPDADYNGPDTITYTVSDGQGGTDVGEVAVTVGAVNDGPVAKDDTFNVTQDEAAGDVDGSVLGNDTDADGDTLSVSEVNGLAANVGIAVAGDNGGLVTINADGTVDFDANGAFIGLGAGETASTSVTYQVTDGNGGSDTATATFVVAGLNDGPDAQDDVANTTIGAPVTIAVLANDSDPDGDPLEVISATSPDGTVDINPDGTITFTPNPGVDGDVLINYTIQDPAGLTDDAIVTVTVRDGIVEGTNGAELIDAGYTGDPEGDVIDGGDAILPGEGPNDDIVVAGGGNDTVYAGEGSDEVDGGDGNDQIFGEAGDDELLGRKGNDLVDGGTGNDSIGGNDGNDTLVGGLGDDTLRGGNDDDSVSGGAGMDSVTGGAGNDTLSGGDEDDTLKGGDGNDSVMGDGGNDLIETDNSTSDALDYETFLGVPVDGNPNDDRDFVDGGAGNDTISTGDDADTIIGGTGADSIDSGIDDDSVIAGDGADYVDAGLGSDFVDGGIGDDTIIAGVDAFSDYIGDDPVLTPPGGLLNPDGTEALTDPNQNDGKDTVIGGAGNDLIITGDDADSILGGADNDTIDAGIDDDFIDAGDGADSVIGGHGSDLIYGGEGADTINAGDSNLLFGQEVDATDPVPQNGLDTVYGGGGNDVITGEDDDDLLFGEAGNDFIDGGIDEDTIDGGIGNDTLIGGQGDDSLRGGDGDDLVQGGTGDDTIEGGGGFDTLDGGDGNDSIAGAGEGDLIFGGAGNDTIEGAPGGDTIDAGADDDLVRGGINDDSILGGTGNDTLDGEAGNDTLDGGDGDDSVRGGAGNDTITGGAGTDRLIGQGDRDLFYGITQNDSVDGGEAGDDFDTLDLTGAAQAANPGGTLNVTYDPLNAENGTVTFRDAGGNVTGTVAFENIENVIPCFTPGTLIATPQGERRVEELEVGDRVITRDNGIQEIRWLGAKALDRRNLVQRPDLKPVLIQAGSLGNNLPERDMLVSPNHRVLVNNDKTALYFEEREVLVAAKHLTGVKGVDTVETMGTTYIHFMFDQHEVVLSDGAWTESFQPGDYTLNGIGNAQRNEIFELFPELRHAEGIEAYQSARKSLKKHEAALLFK